VAGHSPRCRCQTRRISGSDTTGAPALTLVKSVAEMAAEKGEQPLGPDEEVEPGVVVEIGPGKPRPSEGRPVREYRLE